MNHCKEWFIVVLALIGLVLFLVAMFMNYNLTLGTRTAKLEKKNGSEQKQINELKAEIQELKRKQGDQHD